MPIQYKCGYKYQLAADYHHPYMKALDGMSITTRWFTVDGGRLILRAGYAWDGPSGPTIDTESFMRGSAVHDAFYQLMRMTLLSPDLRDVGDRELQRICIEDGMTRIRAWWVYVGVSKFGGPNVRASNRRPIYLAGSA